MVSDLVNKEIRTNLFAFLIILFLTLLLSFPYVNVGLDRDEGAYLLIASKILHGGVPYRDILESKPIALYFFLTIPAYLFGNWIYGLRVFGFLLVAITAFIIFLIGKNLRDIELGFLSSFIFILLQLFTPSMLGFLILSETISNLFIVLAVYFLLFEKPDIKTASIVGLLSSLAFLTRQTAVLLVIITPIYIYYSKEIKQKSKYFCYFLLGALSIIAIFTLYLIINSAFWDAIYNTFLSMLDPSGPYATGEGASLNTFKFLVLLYFLFNGLIITILAIIGIKNLQNTKERFILLWLIFSIIFAQVSPSIFMHYYIIVLPALSLLAGIGCKKIFGIGKIFHKNKKIYYLTTLISIIAVAVLIIAQFSYFVPYPIFVMNGGKAYADTLSYNDEISIIEMLKNTSKDEKIFVFPSEPEIYYLTGKDPLSEKIHFNDVWFMQPNNDQLNKYTIQLLSEKRPKYVIIANNSFFESINKTSNGRIFIQYVDTYYHPSREIGIAQIYEIN